MATGISTAALLGVVAGLARDAAGGQGAALPTPEPLAPSATVPVMPASVTPSTIVPVTPETVVVVREIHRTVYVDEHGNPVGPPTVAAAAPTPATARRNSRSIAAPAAPPAPPQAAPAPPPRPGPVAKPQPPACSGSKCP
jgi:hypothetical protein